VYAQGLDLRTLPPLDEPASLAALRDTRHCVVVQEGGPYAGGAAELIALVVREAFDWLDAPPERVTNLHVPMPYAGNLEALVLPSPERIAAAGRRVLGRPRPPGPPAGAAAPLAPGRAPGARALAPP